MRIHFVAALLLGAAVPVGGKAPIESSSPPQVAGALGTETDEPEAIDTQLELSSLAVGDIRTFDISGFKLGMSLKEANRVARKSGYQRMPLRGHRNFSFEGRARLKANYSLSQKLPIPRFVQEDSGAIASGGRKLIIDWLPTAQGIRIHKLSYEAPTEGNDPATILAQLEQKYGPATTRRGNELTWCSGNIRDCSGFVTEKPKMVASVGAKLRIHIHGGTLAEERNEQAIKARAAQLASSQARPVSF